MSRFTRRYCAYHLGPYRLATHTADLRAVLPQASLIRATEPAMAGLLGTILLGEERLPVLDGSLLLGLGDCAQPSCLLVLKGQPCAVAVTRLDRILDPIRATPSLPGWLTPTNRYIRWPHRSSLAERVPRAQCYLVDWGPAVAQWRRATIALLAAQA